MRWVGAELACGDVDPLAFFGATREDERFFWSRDDDAIAVTGSAYAIESDGPDRFPHASAALDALVASLDSRLRPSDAPLAVGGFAFGAGAPGSAWRGWPALRFLVPALGMRRRAGRSVLFGFAPVPAPGEESEARAALERRLRDASARSRALPAAGEAAMGEPAGYRIESDRSHAIWCRGVEAARRAVRRGALEKVVLARAVRLASDAPISTHALLDGMRRVHPRCATFAVGRGDETFLGASPERLVELRADRVEAAAVAGSAARGRGPEEDAALARALCESKKEQEEHAVVVRAVRAALEGPCQALEVPESPRVLRLENIQHLETPIRGRLRGAANLIDLAARLHPTPAVAGAPREAALDWLVAHETLDRGWYAGGVGIVDMQGGGELRAALRCALVGGAEARLYAGAGIVADSEPRAELTETRLKLRALLAPLLEI